MTIYGHRHLLGLTLLLATVVPASGAEPGAFDCLIEPHIIVDVGSPEHGIVETLGVERSDVVSERDVVAQIEASEQRASVRKAQASARMRSQIKAREAALDLAVRKQQRISELFSSNAISSHQRDEVDTEVTVARMQLRQAQENRTLARLDLERAQSDLARRTIRSPISGVVVERFVAPGEYVNEKPLLRIAQMDPLRVEAVAPASAFGSVREGMLAEVITENAAGRKLTAKVRIVDRLIDPASGTFGIRLELPNPDYAIPSGLNCQVRILPNIPEQAPQQAATTVASVNKDQPRGAAAAMAAKTALKATANETVCRSFGPFSDAAAVDLLAAKLGNAASSVARRDAADDSSAAGYIVLTDAADSLQAARLRVEQLRGQGISDVAVLTRPPYRARISLGLYSERDGAQVHSQKMNARGVATRVVPRTPSAHKYWLDVEIDAQTVARLDNAVATPSVPCDANYVAPTRTAAATK